VDDALNCLEMPGSTWLYTSAGDDQVIEYFEKGIGTVKDAMQFTAQLYKEPFADELGRTDLIQHRCDFANGSRIIGRPCNPRTARGFPGNATFDEFAHVELSHQIFAAVARGLARGGRLRMLSTPNGEQGKFYDLAKAVGFAEGVEPPINPLRDGDWSWHWLDIHKAVAQGCPISVDRMRQLFKGDDDAFNQEFLCIFLKAMGAWLTLDLVANAEDAACDGVVVSDYREFNMQAVLDRCTGGRLSLGIDFGRSGDRTCAWLREDVGDVAWCRLVLYLHNMPFFIPEAELGAGHFDQEHALMPLVKLADRTALDSTGLGIPLYEKFNANYPGHVMGVNFAGSIKRMEQGDATARVRSGLADTVAIKIAMATGMKRRYEQHKNRIPHDAQVRGELMAIKREQTSTAVTFDAPRIEVDSPAGGGSKKKAWSHAEAFWSQAMADLAAEGPQASLADGYMAGVPRSHEFSLERVAVEF
jgi:phage FluMu gp28-like protein